MAYCSEISCDTGDLTLDQVLLRLFAVDSNGCIGIKLVWLWGEDCDGFESLDACAQVVTVEEAVKQAIVSDGCDGWGLGAFFVAPADPE